MVAAAVSCIRQARTGHPDSQPVWAACSSAPAWAFSKPQLWPASWMPLQAPLHPQFSMPTVYPCLQADLQKLKLGAASVIPSTLLPDILLQKFLSRAVSRFLPLREISFSRSMLGAVFLVLFVIHTNTVSSWTGEISGSWAPGESQEAPTHRHLHQMWAGAGPDLTPSWQPALSGFSLPLQWLSKVPGTYSALNEQGTLTPVTQVIIIKNN